MSDRSSLIRKRALRLLAREQRAAYAAIYEEIRPAAASSNAARGQARTQLRQRFPNRYFELYAQESAGRAIPIPAAIRSKSWQRATARLADVRARSYRESFERYREQGMNHPRASERAMAAVREADSALFARLLTQEYELWLSEAGDV